METKATKELDPERAKRLEALRWKMQCMATRLGLGWDKVKASLRMDIEPSHLRDFQPDEIDTSGPEPCLASIFRNLADNSADHFSPDRESQNLEVAVSSKDKRGRISFEIQDNGPGIPSIGSRRIDASSLVRHEGSNLAIATNEIRDLGGASFAQNVVNGDTGRIKGLRITAVFPRQPKE